MSALGPGRVKTFFLPPKRQHLRAIASFSLATGESWKDKATGENRERTEWHRIVIFNEALVKIAEQYLKKGSRVYIEGKNQTRKYTDSQGIERSIAPIGMNPKQHELPAGHLRLKGQGELGAGDLDHESASW